MPLETPRLDDRTFADLLAEARQRIPLYTPEWTDHNASDPGITLLELFAWLMDVMLYRLNRVPDKHYVKLMELIGIHLREAEAAHVPVTFWLTAAQPTAITIQKGTEVATTRTETQPAIVFTTDADFTVRVPELVSVMTSQRHSERQRSFEQHSVKSLAAGTESVKIFADAPQPGDALYLGFTTDLSHHILGLEMNVESAGGAGVDPTNPPYVWEVYGAEGQWITAEVDEDTTGSFNVPGTVRLHLPGMSRATRHEQEAFWVRCRLSPGEGVRSYEVSPEVRRLVTSAWGGTIPTTHARTVRNEFLGRSDGSPGQTFFLEHLPVLPREPGEQLIVRTRDDQIKTWTEVSDFAQSEPDDRHYTLDSLRGEIRVGPALPQRDGSVHRYGATPPKDASLVMKQYRYGGGQVGNVAKHTINVLKTGLPYIERVTNREPGRGGLDAEDLEDAKLRVPGYLRSLNRAVTAEDFEYLTREAAPGMISRVFCLQPPLTKLGEVKVLVIPRVPEASGFIAPEHLELPDDLRQTVTDYLDERRLISTQLDVLSPAYHWVSTRVRLRAADLADPEEVRQRVEQHLFRFLNPVTGGPEGTGWPFGRDLFVSDVMASLLTVKGVNFVRSVELIPVNYNRGQFREQEPVQEMPLVTHGVVASYQHRVEVV